MRLSLTGFLCLFFTLVSCNSQTTVAYRLPEREANEVVVLLTSHGVAAQKMPAAASAVGGESSQQMWDILVPAKSVTEAIALLNQAGLPRSKGTSLLELFGEQGLVPSEMQNKIRYQEGLSEQLANTIRKMDGIVDADVQITFPHEETEVPIPLTAMVYVKHRGVLDNPNSLMITKIKRLISSSIPGLTIDNVSVITDRALIADITIEELEVAQEYEYVSIWGVIVAKHSVGKFRFILYSMMVCIFLLFCSLVWLCWKIYPLVNTWGVTTLFKLSPYELPDNPPKKHAKASEPTSGESSTEELESFAEELSSNQEENET